MSNDEGRELERLRAVLAHEQQVNDMLERSLNELQVTVDDLDKRVERLDEDSSEWKTRYETQVETNQQLHLQALVLAEKVEEAKHNLKDSKLPKSMKMFDEQTEVTPHYVKTLERSKQIFESQLRDLEWRLDQESKAYHKANEERKNYVLEINNAKGTLANMRLQHPLQGGVRTSANIDSYTDRSQVNIPQDYRVIDTRRGPIKRTAAVKQLPPID